MLSLPKSLLTLVCEERCYCQTVELQQVDYRRSSAVTVFQSAQNCQQQRNSPLFHRDRSCLSVVFVLLYIVLFQAGLINWLRCMVLSELCARCPATGPAAAGRSSHVRVPLWRQKLWQKVTSVQGLLCNWFCVVSSHLLFASFILLCVNVFAY